MAAGTAWAGEPADALIPSQALVRGDVRWTGDDALGRWSLVAGARRGALDAVEADPAVRFPAAGSSVRHALAADAASGRLAFDAQRAFLGQRLDARLAAMRTALALREDTSGPGASLDERSEWRGQGTRYSISASLVGQGRWLGRPWERTLGVHVAGDTADARSVLGDGWTGAESVLRRDAAAETRTSFEVRQSIELAPAFHVAASTRIDRVRASATAPGSMSLHEITAWAPAFEAAWTPGHGISLYAGASRGAEDAARAWQALNPFTANLPGAIDPEARAARAESGVRLAAGSWALQLSAWAADLPNGLAYTETGAVETPLRESRHGVGLGLRYQPLPGLELHGEARLALSRADGPKLPGAPRVFGSAGATLRMSRDWDAKLRVSYLGMREDIDDGAPLQGASLANFQVIRWLGRTTRVSLDVFNVFDKRPRVVDSFVAARSGFADGAGESFLESPSEPRAFLLKFRTRF